MFLLLHVTDKAGRSNNVALRACFYVNHKCIWLYRDSVFLYSSCLYCCMCCSLCASNCMCVLCLGWARGEGLCQVHCPWGRWAPEELRSRGQARQEGAVNVTACEHATFSLFMWCVWLTVHDWLIEWQVGCASSLDQAVCFCLFLGGFDTLLFTASCIACVITSSYSALFSVYCSLCAWPVDWLIDFVDIMDCFFSNVVVTELMFLFCLQGWDWTITVPVMSLNRVSLAVD